MTTLAFEINLFFSARRAPYPFPLKYCVRTSQYDFTTVCKVAYETDTVVRRHGKWWEFTRQAVMA